MGESWLVSFLDPAFLRIAHNKMLGWNELHKMHIKMTTPTIFIGKLLGECETNIYWWIIKLYAS